jgi:D-alanyl-D-alanine carboxypeptidase/D-alanyl-D-alanine-endopeptidase (penicillin-binding protein 4)
MANSQRETLNAKRETFLTVTNELSATYNFRGRSKPIEYVRLSVKRLLVAASLVAFLLPSQAGPSTDTTVRKLVQRPTVLSQLQAVEVLKTAVQAQGQNFDLQGILIESLDGRQTLASENADSRFNPASVMKLATSLAALSKLGPDFRYRTDVLADGRIDLKARRLEGDLVIKGAADPMFALADAQELARKLTGMGVVRVSGGLRLAGPFYYFATGYHSNLSLETSATKLRDVLRRAGIKIDGPTVFGPAGGEPLLSHYSDRLLHLLLYQNAHSSNAIAEVVGESVGGPQAIQEFLIREVGLREEDIYVGRASGLEVNRITPRASLRVLRALMTLLSDHGLKPEDVMPIAGIDSGTLMSRFSGEGIRGSVIAKTGTLVSIDNGVSTLAGIAHTRTGGTLLFAIFNSNGGVRAYRKIQDQFLTQVIEEEGGGVQCSPTEDRLANTDRDAFSGVFVRGSGGLIEQNPTNSR